MSNFIGRLFNDIAGLPQENETLQDLILDSDTRKIKRFLRNNKNHTVDGIPAAIFAVTSGRDSALEALLEGGTDINAQDGNGWTALMHATRGWGAANLHLLLEKGADVHLRSTTGETAIITAAHRGRIAHVSALLEKGALIEDRDNLGQTPLMHAAIGGSMEATVQLINQGADIHAESDAGETAQMLAKANKYSNISQFLQQIEERDSRPARKPKAPPTATSKPVTIIGPIWKKKA